MAETAERKIRAAALRLASHAKERELPNSKFKVGQLVEFRPVRASLPASSREYKILRLLPREGIEQEYRIKSASEIYERIAKESELSRRA
jgi:hypothetical protein